MIEYQPDPEAEARAKAYFKEHILPIEMPKTGEWGKLPQGQIVELHGWQPIATAPKDGRTFLAFEPHDAGGFQFVACVVKSGQVACMMTGDSRPRATDWMPLPESPK